MVKSKTKSKSQTDLVRHWELSPIGRRILREVARAFGLVAPFACHLGIIDRCVAAAL